MVAVVEGSRERGLRMWMGLDYCNDALWVWILVLANTGFYGILTQSMWIRLCFLINILL